MQFSDWNMQCNSWPLYVPVWHNINPLIYIHAPVCCHAPGKCIFYSKCRLFKWSVLWSVGDDVLLYSLVNCLGCKWHLVTSESSFSNSQIRNTRNNIMNTFKHKQFPRAVYMTWGKEADRLICNNTPWSVFLRQYVELSLLKC
jgi:hypothetical protein